MTRKVGLLCLVLLLLGGVEASPQLSNVGQWSSLQPLPIVPIHAHLLPTGKVMVYPGDEGISGDDPRLWDPADGTSIALPKVGYDIFCSGHSFLGDGRLLITGGHIVNNVGLASASIYNPFANGWMRLPDMNAGRWYPTNTTLANGDVLVVSGDVDTSIGVNRLPQVYQVASNTWRNLTNAQLSLGLYPFMHLAPNGRVFNSGPAEITRYLDTSGAGAWSLVADRTLYRGYGSSVMYDIGKVLLIGGAIHLLIQPRSSTSMSLHRLGALWPPWFTLGDS